MSSLLARDLRAYLPSAGESQPGSRARAQRASCAARAQPLDAGEHAGIIRKYEQEFPGPGPGPGPGSGYRLPVIGPGYPSLVPIPIPVADSAPLPRERSSRLGGAARAQPQASTDGGVGTHTKRPEAFPLRGASFCK
jgi:hypothetical protein